MAKNQITGFEIRPIREQSGLLGRRKTEDQILRMDVPGGSVFIRRSTLMDAGGNWVKLKRRITRLSEEKDIPLTDYTLDE